MLSSDFASILVRRALSGAVLAFAVVATACGSKMDGGEPAVEIAAGNASTPSSPSKLGVSADSDSGKFAPRSNWEHPPLGQSIQFPQPRAIPPSEHPGLRTNKVVKKLDALADRGKPRAPLAPVSLEVQQRQAAYLAEWEKQRGSVSDGAAAEQERKRVDLKRKMVGE